MSNKKGVKPTLPTAKALAFSTIIKIYQYDRLRFHLWTGIISSPNNYVDNPLSPDATKMLDS
jgi:hypothetical protein